MLPAQTGDKPWAGGRAAEAELAALLKGARATGRRLGRLAARNRERRCGAGAATLRPRRAQAVEAERGVAAHQQRGLELRVHQWQPRRRAAAAAPPSQTSHLLGWRWGGVCRRRWRETDHEVNAGVRRLIALAFILACAGCRRASSPRALPGHRRCCGDWGRGVKEPQSRLG